MLHAIDTMGGHFERILIVFGMSINESINLDQEHCFLYSAHLPFANTSKFLLNQIPYKASIL